ncbi:hypothetical protein LSUE1_G004400 [Lachnellula suecica]|uniref:Uncharacterized protein n=1 Tax=Lachnellula suecica TaxID=602035 RepID=A0A8T9C3Y8_9HELO|nr:hypothetical protein LSUE1_G004400 [Lachnellula suecica]
MRAIVMGGLHGTRSRNNKTNETTDATATPIRARPLRTASRPPLTSRDNNAMMRAQKGPAPLTAKSGNANMPPYEKQNTHTNGRPLMPTLSASAKASGRPPLTPRVAASASPAVSTPLSRRPPRPESNTTPSRDDLSTPVSSFLNSNITPRSGSRKHRVDSANSTPTGTPTGTPAPPSTSDLSRFQDGPVYSPGLGIAGMDKDAPKRPTVSFGPAASDLGSTRSPVQSNSGDSKFFFASDAKPIQPQRPPIQTKTSNFFYASGETLPPQPQSSSASAVGSSVGDDRAQPKFFHANGTPDLQLSPSPHFPPPRPSSVVSTSSRITSPRLATASPGTLSPPQRPSSPVKQHASIPSLRAAPSLPSPVLPRPPTGGRGQSASNIVAARRASIETPPKLISHGRSASSGSTGAPIRRISGGSSIELVTPTTPLNIITTSVPVSTPEEEPTEDNPSELQSPIKPGQSLEQLNELAGKARRERKVLDLEIRNQSLEAINRTLEREMRKQTAELRRYRRLSRSGRLSIATSASMRTSTALSSANGDISPDEEEEEDSEASESENDVSSESDSHSGSLSPSAIAESDRRHRKRDERRLQLDLSKHQQLLVDSQKMNQSLKRCLGWTEALIAEGRKALEYHVRVSDVEMGGRILTIDEDVEAEGMSEIGASMLREARQAAAAGWDGVEGKEERDSGIEIDARREPPP